MRPSSSAVAVSYTHLDVYKRQVIGGVIVIASVFLLGWAESLLNKKQAKAAETAP